MAQRLLHSILFVMACVAFLVTVGCSGKQRMVLETDLLFAGECDTAVRTFLVQGGHGRADEVVSNLTFGSLDLLNLRMVQQGFEESRSGEWQALGEPEQNRVDPALYYNTLYWESRARALNWTRTQIVCNSDGRVIYDSGRIADDFESGIKLQCRHKSPSGWVRYLGTHPATFGDVVRCCPVGEECGW